MEDSFTQALKWVLVDEGGNDDDPHDHGGRTSRGIIQREYDAWRSRHGLSTRDVWIASDDEVRTIYHDEYWLPYCPDLPKGVDYIFFDLAVNGGPLRAIQMLQKALGVQADGHIGPLTKQALAMAVPREVIDKFTEFKRQFYLNLHQPRFLRGWLNRTANVHKRALSMIGG